MEPSSSGDVVPTWAPSEPFDDSALWKRSVMSAEYRYCTVPVLGTGDGTGSCTNTSFHTPNIHSELINFQLHIECEQFTSFIQRIVIS